MSMEQVKAFYAKLGIDETMQSELQDVLGRYDAKTKQQAEIALIQFAYERGFSFNTTELKIYAKNKLEEMAREELAHAHEVEAEGDGFAGYCVLLGVGVTEKKQGGPLPGRICSMLGVGLG